MAHGLANELIVVDEEGLRHNTGFQSLLDNEQCTDKASLVLCALYNIKTFYHLPLPS